MLVFLIWTTVAGPLMRPKTQKPAPKDQATVSGGHTPASPADQASRPTSDNKASPGDENALTVTGADAAETLTLGEKPTSESAYRMQITLSNIGASIDTVRLSDHRQKVDSDEAYRLLKPIDRAPDGKWRSLAIERIRIDDALIRLDQAFWKADKRVETGVQQARFSVVINKADAPLVEISRTFTLRAQPADGLQSDLGLSLRIRNLSDDPHEVILTSLGAMGLSKEGRFGTDRKVYSATLGPEGEVVLGALSFSDVTKAQLRKSYSRSSDGKLLWYAAGNLYFTCTMAPVNEQGEPAGDLIDEISAFDLDGDKSTPDEVTARIRTRRIELAADGAVTLHTDAYLGPKDRHAFESQARYAQRDYMLQITDNYGSCTFSFLIKWMIGLIDWLEGIIPNYGVAIILLVIVVRLLLHPITRKTQVNMVKMQQNMGQLQPKIDEVKRKYSGDNRKMQEEMMKLYREEGINPLGQVFSCLPMMLQMPIWVALYSSLNNNVAMRGRGFVGWIHDLTAPDCLFAFDHPVKLPLIGTLTCFSLLPILVGVFMFAQQKLMPKAKKPTGEHAQSSQAQQAEQMQKIMPYMSLVMILIFYKFPSGLNLYIMTSSMIGTAEQVYIRRHIAQYEAREREGRFRKKPRKALPGEALWRRLQKQADEAQKLRTSRRKPRR